MCGYAHAFICVNVIVCMCEMDLSLILRVLLEQVAQWM